MTKDEALQMCLEYIETDAHERKYVRHAIKAALEAKDEPVAWMRTSGTGSPVVTEALLIEMPEMRWNFQQPLYTTSPQRKPLTEEKFKHMPELFVVPPHHVEMVVRAIEAAHGIKGEA